MSRKFENKPPCEGGCQPPYEQFVSKAGRACQKCTICGNLVWGKPTAAPAKSADPATCPHTGGRLQKVANSAENKGRAYSVCGQCNGAFEWNDVAQTNGTAVPQLALSSVVADLQSKVDSLFKTVLVLQNQIAEQNERLDKLEFIGEPTAATATETNKRRKT